MPSGATCGPRLWVPDLDLSISSRKNVSRPRLSLTVSGGLQSNKYSVHFCRFFCRILAVQHAQKAFYFCRKLIMIFGGAAQWRTWEGIKKKKVAHLRGNVVHHCLFHKFHCDCFCSDIDGVQNKVICLRIETTCSMNVASTWRLRVGFAYRLCRLKPRASRSKGAPTNCGTHRVNGRYIISQIKLHQKLMS